MEGNNRGGVFWGIVGASAVLCGLLVALVVGYLIGHFSHTRVKTVTSARAPALSLRTPAVNGSLGGSNTTAPAPTTSAPATTPTTATTPPPRAPAAPPRRAAPRRPAAPPRRPAAPPRRPAAPPRRPAAPPAAAGGGAASAAGRTVFTTNCASCHTLRDAATTGTVGPNLDQLRPAMADVVRQVTNGGGGMPAFSGQLSAGQIQQVATYVSSVAGR